VAQPIPRPHLIAIGGVVDHGEAMGGAIGFGLVAPDVQEWPNNRKTIRAVSVADFIPDRQCRLRLHPGHPRQSRAAQKVHKDRLGLVVHCVAGEDRPRGGGARHPRERRVSTKPKIGFSYGGKWRAVGPSQPLMNEREGKAHRERAHRLNVRAVPGPDTVPYMGNGHRPMALLRDSGDRVGKADAIRAAGAGNEEMRCVGLRHDRSHRSVNALAQAVRGLRAIRHRCIVLYERRVGADGGIRTCDIGLMSPPLCH
jgi:hypothetical protein